MNLIRRESSPVSTYRPGTIDDQLGRLVENMFEDFLAPLVPFSASTRVGRQDGGMITPRLDASETDQTYEIEAELPGVGKDDVKISVDGRRVTIEAEEKQEVEQKGENATYSQRSLRRYSRTFALPVEVDDVNAQARLENGILKLTLPKKQSMQGKTVTVQ
jgi:HSP20 family protein